MTGTINSIERTFIKHLFMYLKTLAVYVSSRDYVICSICFKKLFNVRQLLGVFTEYVRQSEHLFLLNIAVGIIMNAFHNN